VQFTGIVRPEIVTRSFTCPIVYGELSDDLSIELDPINGTFTVQARSDIMRNYNPPADALSIDISAVQSPGLYRLPLVFTPAAGLTLLRLEPEQLDVRVFIEGNE
jgi:hypothetical protein